MTNVVMVVTGTAGDIHPLIAISRELIDRGHLCTLITHAPFADRVRRAEIEFVPLDTPEEYRRLLQSSTELVGRNHDPGARAAAAGWYHSPDRARLKFSEVRRRVGASGGVVIARYLSEAAAVSAAEASGAGAAWSLVSPHAVSEAAGIAQLHGPQYLAALNEERQQFALPPLSDWLTWINATPRLGLWPRCFAPDMGDIDGLRITGFPGEAAERLPDDLWEFLAEGPPPVLVTAGSGMMLIPSFHQTAVAGCLRAGRRVILVGGPGHPRDGWPPARVRQWAHLSLGSVIPHVAAVIHHGGIGTVARCLEAGAPQLVLAEGVDRPDNAARLHRLGVAEFLPASLWRLSPVAAAVAQLCDDPRYSRNAAEWKAVMRADHGVQAAADHIEELMLW